MMIIVAGWTPSLKIDLNLPGIARCFFGIYRVYPNPHQPPDHISHLGTWVSIPWADGPLLRLTFFRPCHRWATNCAAGSKHWKGRRTRHLAPSLWLWTRCLRNGDLGWIGWVMIFCFFLWFWASNKWIGSDSGQTASKSYRNTQL